MAMNNVTKSAHFQANVTRLPNREDAVVEVFEKPTGRSRKLGKRIRSFNVKSYGANGFCRQKLADMEKRIGAASKKTVN